MSVEIQDPCRRAVGIIRAANAIAGRIPERVDHVRVRLIATGRSKPVLSMPIVEPAAIARLIAHVPELEPVVAPDDSAAVGLNFVMIAIGPVSVQIFCLTPGKPDSMV